MLSRSILRSKYLHCNNSIKLFSQCQLIALLSTSAPKTSKNKAKYKPNNPDKQSRKPLEDNNTRYYTDPDQSIVISPPQHIIQFHNLNESIKKSLESVPYYYSNLLSVLTTRIELALNDNEFNLNSFTFAYNGYLKLLQFCID